MKWKKKFNEYFFVLLFVTDQNSYDCEKLYKEKVRVKEYF